MLTVTPAPPTKNTGPVLRCTISIRVPTGKKVALSGAMVTVVVAVLKNCTRSPASPNWNVYDVAVTDIIGWGLAKPPSDPTHPTQPVLPTTPLPDEPEYPLGAGPVNNHSLAAILIKLPDTFVTLI